MKKAGILMPVSALPSRTGAGELGGSSFEFLELLWEHGIRIWQILPLNPLGYGNSPYQPYSSFAGDPLYISLDRLYEKGLLEEMAPDHGTCQNRVDYEEVRSFKEPYFRAAYEAFVKRGDTKREAYIDFISQDWVEDYGVFSAMKAHNDRKCWLEWPREQKEWPKERKALSAGLTQEADFQKFLQYLFYVQWTEVKEAANQRGIRIMGDLPFYVGMDSVDVWAGRENFLLDEDGKPRFIAGVPPDYFSATGQRWGNPIYDWDYLEKQNFRFWVDRIGYNTGMFDILRIDHFRAFDTYWKIPASCPTAMVGEWVEAPGYQVLERLREQIPGLCLVAEDLGDLRQEVMALKNHYHLKGMKILEFTIDTSGKYAVDNFQESENTIVYTGTHDNSTLMQWYRDQNGAGRRKLRKFLRSRGFGQGFVKQRLILYALHSRAEYVVIPMGDILGISEEGRINTPGTVGSPNWEWRLPELESAGKELKKLMAMYRKTSIRSGS